MTHAAAVDWIEKTPRRWARNGAIIGLIWVVPFIIFTAPARSPLFAALGVALVMCLLSLLGWLCGLGARRRLRRVVSLDHESADRAVSWLPGRYGLFGALLGVLFSVADLVLKWPTGEVASGDSAPALEDMIVYVAALPIGGALVGGFVGVITADQIRKRLARNAN
jgi:hypothetical protein